MGAFTPAFKAALQNCLVLSASIPHRTSPYYHEQINPNGNLGAPRYSWLGSIDDVRIYSRALSTNEVQQLYAIESVPQPTNPPSITSQPQPLTVNAHANVSFTVTATGNTPLNYQWSLNGTNISGATASSLTISNVTPQVLGAYAVVITNAFGSATSSNAMLSMYPFLALPFIGVVTDWGHTTH